MIEYKCTRCGKLFNKKSNYDCHINRKYPCKSNQLNKSDGIQNESKRIQNESKGIQNELKNGTIGSKKYKCLYCNINYSTNSNMNKHMKKCKIKIEQDNQKENLLQKLIDEMKKQNKEIAEMKEEIKKKDNHVANLEMELRKLKSKSNQVQNITNIDKQINQQNIQVNNIKLLAFGKEDMTHLADEVCKKILNKGFKSVPNLVEYVHFNKNKPQNHNVYISNMQNNYVLVYDGNDWKLKERDDILQQLVDDKTEILSEKFDNLLDKLDESTIKKFQRFLDQKDEDKIISGIKNDLKLLLYNNRKIPEKTRNLLYVNTDIKELDCS